MNDLWSILHDAGRRLLQEAEPMSRYCILTEILEKPKSDSEVAGLRKSLIEEVIGKQLENGSWNNKVYDYEEGTTHQLMRLIELDLTAEDEHVRKAAEYMLKFQAEDGAFIQGRTMCGARANLVTTNAVLLALARAGYSSDARVAKGYEWLCGWQQEDGSWLSPEAKRRRDEGKGYPHPYCGLHATCNVLLGLSATERTRRSEAAKRGVNYLLGLYGYKYEIDEDIEPPYFRFIINKRLVPFEGAWHDPRCVPPDIGSISRKSVDRIVEIATTGGVLMPLSMLGYGLDNEKVRKGLNRLIQLQTVSGITLRTLMIMKSLYQGLSVFSFHGH